MKNFVTLLSVFCLLTIASRVFAVDAEEWVKNTRTTHGNNLNDNEIKMLLEKGTGSSFEQCASFYDMVGLIQVLFDDNTNTPNTKYERENSLRRITQLKDFLKTGKVKVRPGIENAAVPKDFAVRCNYIAQLATEKVGFQIRINHSLAPVIGKALAETMGTGVTEAKSTPEEINPKDRN